MVIVMTEKQFTVEKLIKELEKLPKHHTVELSVHYDNCHHVQPLSEIYSSESKYIEWIVLIGGEE